MLTIGSIDTYGWQAAIRGMRNPMNSWDRSDSGWTTDWPEDSKKLVEIDSEEYFGFVIGSNDEKLMLDLCKGGPVHAKFRRMLTITMDITAPLYWWKEFDTYKVGTVANSCSTMHKIHAKEFELDDFSHEHLCGTVLGSLRETVGLLNFYRNVFISFDEKSSDPHWLKLFVYDYGLKTKKDIWWQMIQLLPSSYNQKRTVQLNYEVAHNIYISRKNHKLDEWHTLCDALKELPMSELIMMELDNDN